MAAEHEIPVSPEISEEFQNFEEFCTENVGHELAYLKLVEQNPLQVDSVTIAFSMRHLIRLSSELREMLLTSMSDESPPSVKTILASKGIQLDKTQATCLRHIIFSFRDCAEDEGTAAFVRALQLMTISRDRGRCGLYLGDSYSPPDEGWTPEDFGGDESMFEAVRSVEDPQWIKTEEI